MPVSLYEHAWSIYACTYMYLRLCGFCLGTRVLWHREGCCRCREVL